MRLQNPLLPVPVRELNAKCLVPAIAQQIVQAIFLLELLLTVVRFSAQRERGSNTSKLSAPTLAVAQSEFLMVHTIRSLYDAKPQIHDEA